MPISPPTKKGEWVGRARAGSHTTGARLMERNVRRMFRRRKPLELLALRTELYPVIANVVDLINAFFFTADVFQAKGRVVCVCVLGAFFFRRVLD